MNIVQINGSGCWTYDGDACAWHFSLNERKKPPYLELVIKPPLSVMPSQRQDEKE